MSGVSLEAQIRCLEEMISYLSAYCSDMNDCIDDYYRNLVALREKGLTLEFGELYEREYYLPAKSRLEQVIGDSQYGHLRFLSEILERMKAMRD